MSIDEYLDYSLREALLQNTAVHEYCHASAWRHSISDPDRALEIAFAGRNLFVEALCEANADLLALATTSRLGQLAQMGDSLRASNQPAGWDDEHILAARLILNGLAEFDLDSDVRPVAKLLFLRFRDVLVQIKQRQWQGDIQTYVLEQAQSGTRFAQAFDEGLLATSMFVEALLAKPPSRSASLTLSLEDVADLIASAEAQKHLQMEVDLLRAERLIEHGTRMLMVRSCNPALFEEAVHAAKEYFERGEVIARDLVLDSANSSRHAELLRRVDAVKESRTLWGSPPPLLLRSVELILTGMVLQHKEAARQTIKEVQARFQSSPRPMGEALLQLARGLEDQAYADQHTALQAAANWLDHAADSFTITAFTYCMGRLFLDACAADGTSISQWCELVRSGQDEMPHVVRRFLSAQTPQQLMASMEQYGNRLEILRSEARAAVTVSEWLRVLGQTVPLCLIELEYVKALLDQVPGALADEHIRSLAEYGVQHREVIEALAETSLRTRPEHLWSALFDEPLLAVVRSGRTSELPSMIARLQEGLVCIPDCLAEKWKTISRKIENDGYSVPARPPEAPTEPYHGDSEATRPEPSVADAASDAVMPREEHVRILLSLLVVAPLSAVCVAAIGLLVMRGPMWARLDTSLMLSAWALWSVLVVQLSRFGWPGLLAAERKIAIPLLGVALLAVPLIGLATVNIAGSVDAWWDHFAGMARSGIMLARTKTAVLSPGFVVLPVLMFARRAAQSISSSRLRFTGALVLTAAFWILPSVVSAGAYAVSVLAFLLLCTRRLLSVRTS